MNIRDIIKSSDNESKTNHLFDTYGVLSNPFPASNQTSENPHYNLGNSDEKTAHKIKDFIRDNKSQALIIEGTQGVGKTNFLNYFATEIAGATKDMDGFFVVRYLADPENTFDRIIRHLFQELGFEHLNRLGKSLQQNDSPIELVRNQEVQMALNNLKSGDEGIENVMMEWLLGHRFLKSHKEKLGVQFRLDTVEAKTSVLRDLVEVSLKAGVLNGIFLLLDELEKQDGVLGPRPVVRYLSAIRALIDALPKGLFLMMAVTPDALLRYSSALPALRGRLQNRIEMQLLMNVFEAVSLAEFYVKSAREKAQSEGLSNSRNCEILSKEIIEGIFDQLYRNNSEKGVLQREFLHNLSVEVDRVMKNH
ncbi:MAG: DUF2791 family P-loop domain-containing protein [Rhodobacteraceae bacterium]|nr:DUF2791 family P-loop domain-containing protein [Paracoccaceae bacterium]